MPLKLLLDENLRHASLLTALEAQRGQTAYPLDIARVGDPACPPLGCDDDEIIRWAARAKIAFCNDLTVAEILELLQLITHVSDREEWQDAVRWIP